MDILNWVFYDEVSVPSNIDEILVAGEEPIQAYRTVRDTAVFTNKRIIVVDSQGITGKKKEMYSIPYASIEMWSSENAGILDFTSELQLRTKVATIKISLGTAVDVRALERIIATERLK